MAYEHRHDDGGESRPLLSEQKQTNRHSIPQFLHSSNVPIDLNLTLSPYQKMLRYNKFPFKFVLHVLIIAFAVAATITRNIEYSDFISSSSTSLRVLLGNAPDPSVVGPQGATCFYTVADVKAHIAEKVHAYYAFPNVSGTNLCCYLTNILQ
jgi:hypothetical protein